MPVEREEQLEQLLSQLQELNKDHEYAGHEVPPAFTDMVYRAFEQLDIPLKTPLQQQVGQAVAQHVSKVMLFSGILGTVGNNMLAGSTDQPLIQAGAQTFSMEQSSEAIFGALLTLKEEGMLPEKLDAIMEKMDVNTIYNLQTATLLVANLISAAGHGAAGEFPVMATRIGGALGSATMLAYRNIDAEDLPESLQKLHEFSPLAAAAAISSSAVALMGTASDVEMGNGGLPNVTVEDQNRFLAGMIIFANYALYTAVGRFAGAVGDSAVNIERGNVFQEIAEAMAVTAEAFGQPSLADMRSSASLLATMLRCPDHAGELLAHMGKELGIQEDGPVFVTPDGRFISTVDPASYYQKVSALEAEATYFEGKGLHHSKMVVEVSEPSAIDWLEEALTATQKVLSKEQMEPLFYYEILDDGLRIAFESPGALDVFVPIALHRKENGMMPSEDEMTGMLHAGNQGCNILGRIAQTFVEPEKRAVDLCGIGFQQNPHKLLIRTDLRHANLSGEDLTGYRLVGCDLRGADLRGTNLCGATLIDVWTDKHTRLDGARLDMLQWHGDVKGETRIQAEREKQAGQRDALPGITTDEMIQAFPQAGYIFGLRDANCLDYDMSHLDLREVDWQAVDAGLQQRRALRKGKPVGSQPGINMDLAALARVTVRESNLDGADFSGIHLQDIDFSGASLRGATFGGHVSLKKSDFSDAVLSGARFTEVDISGADFQGATLTNTTFQTVTMSQDTHDLLVSRGATVIDPIILKSSGLVDKLERMLSMEGNRRGNMGQ